MHKLVKMTQSGTVTGTFQGDMIRLIELGMKIGNNIRMVNTMDDRCSNIVRQLFQKYNVKDRVGKNRRAIIFSRISLDSP